jgi:hypothetical protein
MEVGNSGGVCFAERLLEPEIVYRSLAAIN